MVQRIVLVAAIIAAVFLTVVLAAKSPSRRPKWHELEEYTFERYVSDFHKSYTADPKEYSMRRGLFESRLTTIKAHNKGHSSYKMGVNHMTDYTVSELKRMGGSKIGSMQAEVREIEKQYATNYKLKGLDNLPASVDYRNSVPPILTAIKDQGMCGSCWAHGATEQIETYWAIATNQLFVLSQEQITQCTPNPRKCGGSGGCGGATADLGFAYVTGAGGIAQEWTYPYTSYTGTTGNCSTNMEMLHPAAEITGYTKLPSNDQGSVLESLSINGPLAVNVDASSWFMYESGVYTGCNYAQNITIDHVVQLIGYGNDKEIGLDYYLIRNSWSPLFGENGFIRILRTANAGCGWNNNAQDGVACEGQPTYQWVCGECGVLFDTSFPNVAPQ